jgi:hypothetical protein
VTDFDALLAAFSSDPRDPVTRAALADWCDEKHGHAVNILGCFLCKLPPDSPTVLLLEENSCPPR